MAKQRVFVDTNVIIEAFRTHCWSAICGRYAVETVTSVVAEALAGDPSEPGYVVVDEGPLRGGLSKVHASGRASARIDGTRPGTAAGASHLPG